MKTISVISQITIGLVAVIFFYYGVMAMIDPSIAANLVGIELTQLSSRTEMRATYGGLFVGVGGLLFFLVFRSKTMGLLTILFLLTPMASTRLFSVISHTEIQPVQVQYMYIEFFIVVVSLVLLILGSRKGL